MAGTRSTSGRDVFSVRLSEKGRANSSREIKVSFLSIPRRALANANLYEATLLPRRMMDRQQVSIVGSEDMNLVFNFPSF